MGDIKRSLFQYSNIVWDNHVCLPMEPSENLRFLPDLKRFKAAGVNVLSLNIGYGQMTVEEHFTLLSQMKSWINQHSDDFIQIQTYSDFQKVIQQKKLGIVFDIEGAAPLNGDLTLVNKFYQLGVRWMLLAYNRNNWAASGLHDKDNGLTKQGFALVQEMQKVGMVVCLSHVGMRACFQTLEIAERPVIFSHSNPYALRPHKRNISDELIKRCASTGGVVGINGLGIFLGQNEVTPKLFAKHIQYVADLVGVEHVALGTDFVFDLDGLEKEKSMMKESFPTGCDYELPTRCLPPEHLSDVIYELIKNGWKREDLSLLLGGNWMRIAKQCWR